MSDKFLGTRSSNLTNGTANIYINQLTVENLDASLPVKTNANKTLISQKLEISDVNNLQTVLNGAVLNPLIADLNFSDKNANNVNYLSFTRAESQQPASSGALKIYASSVTNEIHMVDSEGNDSIIGGDVFDQSLNKDDNVEFNEISFSGVINKKLNQYDILQYSASNGKIEFIQYNTPPFPDPPSFSLIMSISTNSQSYINTPSLTLSNIVSDGIIDLTTPSKYIQFQQPNQTDGMRIANLYGDSEQFLSIQNYVGPVVTDIFTINKELVISSKPLLSVGKITTPELSIGTILSTQYNLPTTAGTPGQHLTMGAGNTTSWVTPYTFTGGTITGNLQVQGITTLGSGATTFQFPNVRGGAGEVLVDFNGTGNVTFQSLSTIAQPAFGVTYMLNNASYTICTVQNTYYDVVGTFLTPGTINTRFVVDGPYNGGLRYTGSIARVFKIDCSGAWQVSAGPSASIEIGFHVNGNVILSGQFKARVDDSTIFPSCFSCSTLINLSNNDTLEIKLRNTTSGQNVNVTNMNFNVVGVSV